MVSVCGEWVCVVSVCGEWVCVVSGCGEWVCVCGECVYEGMSQHHLWSFYFKVSKSSAK